jgi:hypothetical protein
MSELKNDKMKLSEYLLGLADGSIEPANRYAGICESIGEYFRGSNLELDRFLDVAVAWPEFSGSRDYPIPSGGEADPGTAYSYHVENGSLWKGQQLEYRQSLCRFVGEHLKRLGE